MAQEQKIIQRLFEGWLAGKTETMLGITDEDEYKAYHATTRKEVLEYLVKLNLTLSAHYKQEYSI